MSEDTTTRKRPRPSYTGSATVATGRALHQRAVINRQDGLLPRGDGGDVIRLFAGVVIHLLDFQGLSVLAVGFESVPGNRPAFAKVGKLRDRPVVAPPVEHEVLARGIGEIHVHAPRQLDLRLEGVDHVAHSPA